MRRTSILSVLILIIISCSTTHKTVNTTNIKVSDKENSYYYYLLSELKKNPETLEESEALLKKALEKDESSSALWAEQAMVQARHTNWDEALKDAQRSLAKEPNSLQSVILLGKLYAAHGDPAQAITYYKKALNLDPTHEETYSVMAREYLTLKNRPAAISALRQCLNEAPESMSCLYYLASLYLENKEYKEALKSFLIIQQLHPNNPQVLQTISEIYMQQKDYPKALTALVQLKQLTPGDAASGMRLALVYYELKQIDRAIEEFESVLKAYPDSDRLNYYLGLLYDERKEPKKALEFFSKIKSDSQFFKDIFGRLMALNHRFRGSRATLDLLNKRVSEADRTTVQRGLEASLLVDCGDYEAALQIIDSELVRVPTDQRLLFQKSTVLERLSRWDEAKVILKTLLGQNFYPEQIYNFLGYGLLERNENLDEALSYILKASQLKPKDGRITDSLGWAYFKKGDDQKALVYLTLANEQSPDEPEILGHLGDWFVAQNNALVAKQYYEQAVAILNAEKFKTDFELKLLEKLKKKLKGASKK